MKNRKRNVKKAHPWVAMAVFCDRVLEEKENVFSMIRIVDRFTLTVPPTWDRKQAINLPITGFVGFKSGDVKGERTLRVYGVSPKGKRKKFFQAPITFQGGDIGVNLNLQILFGVKTEGTHWFEVYIDNWLATRMPLTIVVEQTKPSREEPKQQK